MLPQIIKNFDILIQIHLQILQIQTKLTQYNTNKPNIDFENITPLIQKHIHSLLTTLNLMINTFHKQTKNIKTTNYKIKNMDPPLTN